MFSLIDRLPSMPSASGCPPLFGHFDGNTRPSDSPPTLMSDFRPKAFSNRPVVATGVDGVSGSRAWSFPACLGSQTARSPRGTRVIAPSMWPSALLNGVGTPNTNISQLDTRPDGAPVNASMAALRLAMHDSGSGWFAKPSLYDSFIHYPTPVVPKTDTPARV